MRPIGTTNLEYGGMTQKYRVSVHFCRKLGIFGKTVGMLSKNLNFLKIRKNSYTGPFGTTNPEYESHGHEIRSFGPFSPQTGNFR
jgi:hypothetical protein